MPLEEDQNLFFEDFGRPAFIEGKPLIGLRETLSLLQQNVRSQKTTFTCPSRAVCKLAPGAQITVDGQAYTIVELQPDGTGMTHLLLEKLPCS